MYPLRVEINENNILKFQNTLKEAYKSILSEIEGATDFGIANRKAILAQIEEILTETGDDVQAFLEKEIPKYYQSGFKDADKQLNNISGVDTIAKTGFNRVHKEAIASLVDDASTAFAESLTGVNRSARLLLGKATRDLLTQKMAEGTIGGKALREVRATLKGILQEQGLDSLVDKGGKSWSLDRYSEMLFRTKAVEARNRGLANRMAENGYDLVQVSSHGADDVCGQWEGKILSLNGDTPGYPTVADAEADGLFHPNCRHAINALIPSLAKATSAYYPDEETKVISESEIQKLSGLD